MADPVQFGAREGVVVRRDQVRFERALEEAASTEREMAQEGLFALVQLGRHRAGVLAGTVAAAMVVTALLVRFVVA